MDLEQAIEDKDIYWRVEEDWIGVYLDEKYKEARLVGRITFEKDGTEKFFGV